MPLHVAKFIIHNSQVLAWLFWAALVVYVSCIVRWAALALQTKLRGVREFSNETSEKRLGTPWYIFMLAGAVLAAVIFLEGTASERVEQYEKCISWFSALDVIAKEDKAEVLDRIREAPLSCPSDVRPMYYENMKAAYVQELMHEGKRLESSGSLESALAKYRIALAIQNKMNSAKVTQLEGLINERLPVLSVDKTSCREWKLTHAERKPEGILDGTGDILLHSTDPKTLKIRNLLLDLLYPAITKDRHRWVFRHDDSWETTLLTTVTDINKWELRYNPGSHLPNLDNPRSVLGNTAKDAAWSPDGNFLAFSTTYNVDILDFFTADKFVAPTSPWILHDHLYRSVAFSPDSKYMAVSARAEAPDKYGFWVDEIFLSKRALKSASALPVLHSNTYAEKLLFSVDGQWIIAGNDYDVALTSVGDPSKIVKLPGEFEHRQDLYKDVPSLAADSRGRLIVAGVGDHLGVWDLKNRSLLANFPQESRVYATAVSDDGCWIGAAVGARSWGTIRLWRVTCSRLPGGKFCESL